MVIIYFSVTVSERFHRIRQKNVRFDWMMNAGLCCLRPVESTTKKCFSRNSVCVHAAVASPVQKKIQPWWKRTWQRWCWSHLTAIMGTRVSLIFAYGYICLCVCVCPGWCWQSLQASVNVAAILGGIVARSCQRSFYFHLLLASFRWSAPQQWYRDNCGVQSDWCWTVFGPSSDWGPERKWLSLPSTSATLHREGWSELS